MKFKIKKTWKTPLLRSGQAMVQVLLLGAVASVTAFGVALSMSSYSKGQKKFNINSDWVSLIGSIRGYANNPNLCATGLGTSTPSSPVMPNFGDPTKSETLGLNNFSPYITKGQVDNSIYIKSINLITDPTRTASDQGDGTTEVPVYLQIIAKKITGTYDAATISLATPDLYSGYVGTGASAKGENLIQFGIIVSNSAPYQIQRCQSYEVQVGCGDLNGASHAVTESGHGGHLDPACQLNQSLTLNSDKTPGSSGFGQIQFGDPYTLNSGNNTPSATVPDLISDNIATRNLAFTANSLVITGSTSSVGINPGASNLHVTGSTQVDGDGAGNVLQVKGQPLQSNSCTTTNCAIAWTQTNLYPYGIYGCGCGSGLFMLSGGATCSTPDLLQINLPDAPTDTPGHKTGSQLIWVGACSNFDQPQSISVTCCTPTWIGAPGVTTNIPPAPTVTGIQVISGPSYNSSYINNSAGGFYYGGDTINISGTGFHSGMTATVGGVTCTSPKLLSATQMSCVTPRLSSMSPSPHIYPVIVSNAVGGSSTDNANSKYSYYPPTVSSIVDPVTGQSNGYYNGGDLITITGAGFFSDGSSPGMTIMFGTAACVNPTLLNPVQYINPNFQYSTQLTCYNPTLPPGSRPAVTVANGNDSGTGVTFSYLPPVLTSITPTSGLVEGGPPRINISGYGFTSGMSAYIDKSSNQCSNLIFNSSTSMSCIPAAYGAGTYNFIIGYASQFSSYGAIPSRSTYQYNPDPTPPRGSASGGAQSPIPMPCEWNYGNGNGGHRGNCVGMAPDGTGSDCNNFGGYAWCQCTTGFKPSSGTGYYFNDQPGIWGLVVDWGVSCDTSCSDRGISATPCLTAADSVSEPMPQPANLCQGCPGP